MDEPALDIDAILNAKCLRYVATGDTYPHREEFISWGWHWDAARGAWVEDNGSDPWELTIRWAKGLPGVTVTEEQDDA